MAEMVLLSSILISSIVDVHAQGINHVAVYKMHSLF